MRLIDADNVNPSDVFIGTSDFATDARIAVCELLRNQPTVDAVPVVHGRWHFDDFDGDGKDYTCSVCGWACYSDYDYCPNCGAKMDRERSRE